MSRTAISSRAAVGAVKILGPARYAWLGRRSRPLPRSVLARLDQSGLPSAAHRVHSRGPIRLVLLHGCARTRAVGERGAGTRRPRAASEAVECKHRPRELGPRMDCPQLRRGRRGDCHVRAFVFACRRPTAVSTAARESLRPQPSASACRRSSRGCRPASSWSSATPPSMSRLARGGARVLAYHGGRCSDLGAHSDHAPERRIRALPAEARQSSGSVRPM